MKANLFVCTLIALALPLNGASAARHAAHVRAQDRALTANSQTPPHCEPLFHGFDHVWDGEASGDSLSNANGS